MAEINPTKLQKPLKDKEGSFYPLTTYDQIIMPDGINRFDGGVIVDRTDATIGEPALINADMLGGIPYSDYALKTDLPNETIEYATKDDVNNAITEAFANIQNAHGGLF